MSILIVQIGQCGNQIGHSFFNCVGNKAIQNLDSQNKNYSSYSEDILLRFFNEGLTNKRCFTANSILIDTETKVISSLHNSCEKLWKYPKISEASHRPTQGSGNNWAYGYKVHGPQQRNNILESVTVRKVAETCDGIDGFLIIQSLAGGTGSGLGTYVTELLRDTYPHYFIFNQVIWPFSDGEVSVQNYNTVLTMAPLYSASDVILTQSNDAISDICMKHLNIENVGFKEINEVISLNLAAILSPFDVPMNQSTNKMGDIAKVTEGDVQRKLFSIVTTPYISKLCRSFDNTSWSSILKSIHRMSEPRRLYLHGVDLPSDECIAENITNETRDLYQSRCYGVGHYDRRATALIKGH